MEPNKKKPLFSFIERTITNLEFINNAKKNGDDVYEITQLINSFLFFIVFPQQDSSIIVNDDSVSNELLEKLKDNITKNTYTESRYEVNLKNILYHLRNAISHGKIETTSSDGEISSLKFSDVNTRDSNQKFTIELTIETINSFIKELSKEVLLNIKNKGVSDE